MKAFLNLLKFFTTFLICTACTSQSPSNSSKKWMEKSNKIKVLSTIAMIDDLVKQIGGEEVETFVLIKGDLDPHSYQLVKGDNEKLSVADIVFFNGLGLEHGPSLRSFLKNSPNAVGLGNLVQERYPDSVLYDKGIVDPHIWMDISLWTKTIPFISETLGKHDPAHKEIFQKRGEKLQEALLTLHQKLKGEMQEVPQEKRYLITSHDAFNYFARAYLATEKEILKNSWEKRFAAPEGLAPESQLSTTDIRQILDHMKDYNIRVMFPESNVGQASIRKLLSAGKEMGIPIKISPAPLYGDAMGPPGSSGDSYYKIIKYDIRTIAKYLNE